MAILNKLTWIDSSALTRFILSAQVRSQTDTGFSFGVFCLANDMFYVRTRRVGVSRTGPVTWWTCSTHCSASPAFLCLVTRDCPT